MTKNSIQLQDIDFEAIVAKMADNYPHPLIPRKDIPKFTNGLLSSKGMATLDSINEGPPSVKFARQRAYPKEAFCVWFKKKLLSDSKKPRTGGYKTHKKSRK